MTTIDNLLKQWARLGIVFNVMLPEVPRLLPACVTWLIRYDRLVCRHRLAGFVSTIPDTEVSATMGFLLSSVKEFSGTDHFNLIIKTCRPLKKKKPLFTIDRMSEQLSQLSQNSSSPLSRQWGLWCQAIRLKDDAIRPLSWIMQQNPSLRPRALFSGNLRASILETLSRDRQAGQSESLLARRCHATRKAVRESLDHLEFCQLILRSTVAGKIMISLC